MKKIHFFCSIVLVSNLTPLHCKSFLPKIEQVKNKIEQAESSLSPVNLKDLFDKAIVSKNPDGTIKRILSREQLPQDDIEVLMKKINDLYWCKQEQFLQDLKNAAPDNKTAYTIVYKKLSEHYTTNSRLMITFAADLVNEEKQLDEIINSILKKLSSDTQNQSQLKDRFNMATTYKKSLQDLITQINKLLVAIQ